jgi:predicted transcriptional regulator
MSPTMTMVPQTEVPMRTQTPKRYHGEVRRSTRRRSNDGLREALSVVVSHGRSLSQSQLRDFVRLFATLRDYEADEEAALVAALAGLFEREPTKLVDLETGVSDEDRKKVERYRAGVAAAIRDRRVALRMTQADLARQCGIPQSHISRLESGQHIPSYLTLESLAKALRTNRAELERHIER